MEENKNAVAAKETTEIKGESETKETKPKREKVKKVLKIFGTITAAVGGAIGIGALLKKGAENTAEWNREHPDEEVTILDENGLQRKAIREYFNECGHEQYAYWVDKESD